MNDNRNDERQTAILAGGCFWCLEAVYEDILGVVSVESGYLNGSVPNPTYDAVCTGKTGHAEAVRIEFDPREVSYRDLLEVFFVIHDPTQLNRQGNDSGTQYRSGIYWLDEAQRKIAMEVIAELERDQAFAAPIVTELAPAHTFYPAEDYHRQYYRRHTTQSYCAFVVAPKLEKFRQKFARLRRTVA
ncbi:MAG TPA: peptide-methionine (S)-S-oxide reductase MsrA [Rhodocyclaceae bacterium]|nr:peptide-methionine (S)-S-oxide reductase MsrA [Rhodocyclaceae bacterium]